LIRYDDHVEKIQYHFYLDIGLLSFYISERFNCYLAFTQSKR